MCRHGEVPNSQWDSDADRKYKGSGANSKMEMSKLPKWVTYSIISHVFLTLATKSLKCDSYLIILSNNDGEVPYLCIDI